MKEARFYWYASCSQCREARKELDRRNYSVEARDFFKERFSEEELRALLKKLKLKPQDVFSYKSPSVRAMKLNVEALTGDEMIALMAQEPRLMRRPLIVIDGKALVGLDMKKLDSM